MKGCGFWLVLVFVLGALAATIASGNGGALLATLGFSFLLGIARGIIEDVLPWLAEHAASRQRRSAEDIYREYFGENEKERTR